MLIEEHERTEKLAVTSKALKEKISAEIETEKTKGKKHDEQLKTAIRLAKLQKTNLESQLIEKNQARIRKNFSQLNFLVFFFQNLSFSLRNRSQANDQLKQICDELMPI